MINSDADVKTLAHELDMTVEEVVRIFESAADALIPSSQPKRARRKVRGSYPSKKRGEVELMPWPPPDESPESDHGDSLLASLLEDDPEVAQALQEDDDFQLLQRFFQSPGSALELLQELADEWGCSVEEALQSVESAMDRLPANHGLITAKLD